MKAALMGIILNFKKLFEETRRKRRGGINAQAETEIMFRGIPHICCVYGAKIDQRLKCVRVVDAGGRRCCLFFFS